MSDACGCGGNEADVGGQAEKQAESLWQVRELQFAAVAGVFLLAELIAGGAGESCESHWQPEAGRL